MKKYLGVKMIEAEPCKGYNNKCYDDNIMYSNDAVFQEGCKVVYEDGYTSWSPKDVFEKAYRQINGLTFGLAIEALKMGLKVARHGWNGKNMYLLLYKGQEDIANAFGYGYGELMGEFSFTDVIAMKTSDGNMVLGWLASQTDMLSEDWFILD